MAAATMAMHGKISPSLAGHATVLTSLASAAVNLPIVWRTIKDKVIVRRLTIEIGSIIAIGVAAVILDQVFQFSDLFLGR